MPLLLLLFAASGCAALRRPEEGRASPARTERLLEATFTRYSVIFTGLAVPPPLPPIEHGLARRQTGQEIYEIVWLQLLDLVIGSTAVAMAVLLGIYLGGSHHLEQ